MAKVYVVIHGHQCIGHRYGVSSFDRRDIKDIYDSEEKVIDHIRKNSANRINVLSRDRYDIEFPTIENFNSYEKIVYARTSDDFSTELYYYIYEIYEVK